LRPSPWRKIPSLQAYAFLSQREAHIELYERQDDGSWRYTEQRGIEAVTKIACLDVILTHAELYARVEPASP